MSIASVFGFGRKVRYGFVGLGDIAQEAMLPGVEHTATRRSRRSSPAIRSRRARLASVTASAIPTTMIASTRCSVRARWTRSISRHRIGITRNNLPALAAGIHVLVEKPLEICSERCRAILEAQRRSTAKLMVAYPLHFEPSTLDTIRRIGRAKSASDRVQRRARPAARSRQPSRPSRVEGRSAARHGPYPVNAARYLFGAEPIEIVSATATRHP